MTTLATIGTYFFSMDTLHADALLEDERRAFAAERVERARAELRSALLAEYMLRPELQAEIAPEDYLNPAGLVLGNILIDLDTPAEIVNAALSEWRRSEARFADPDDLECDCNGFNSDRCPACDAELAGDTIPFTTKEI